MMWHRDFPPDAIEMWDVLMKAFMLKYGCHVDTFSADEIREASGVQAEVALNDDGSIGVRRAQH